MSAGARGLAATRMAAFATSLDARALPGAVAAAARLHLLDALGVALGAASLETRPRVDRAVAALGRGDEATGLGLRDPLPAPSAALLNGCLVHALEFDDTHMAAVMHASAVVVPAALAVAERERRPGAELLAAVAVGWELMARIGLAGPDVFQSRGFQSTAIAGAPVAALVAARLARLDAACAAHAAGIAGSQAGGIFEFLAEGATVKMLHGGWPAHSGVVAAELARHGMTGPASVFEGERGLFRSFAGAPKSAERLARELDDLGERWLLPEASFKPYPCCHYLQAAIECVERVRARGVEPDAITRIECAIPAEIAWLVCEPWETKLAPASGHVAKFSLPYCLAAAFVDGGVDVETFDRDAPDPRLRPLMDRVAFTPMRDSGFPERYPATLRVETRDDRVHEAAIPDVRGGRARPFTPGDVRAKFRANARRILEADAVERIVDSVEHLDAADSIRDLSVALRRVVVR